MDIEWNLILRILIAGLLGGLIGFEREIRAKEAGVRTHFIVALGSALFMIISQFAFSGRFDAARVAAQVVSGIGFIGAGVIIFQENVVRGVTTAAGLWVAAAVGLACGAGMYSVAVAASLLTILCLETMHQIIRWFGEKNHTLNLSPITAEQLSALMDEIQKNGITVESFTIRDGVATLTLRIRVRIYEKAMHQLLTIIKAYKVELS